MNLLHLTAGFPVVEGLRLLEYTSERAGFRMINLISTNERQLTYYSKLEALQSFLATDIVRPSDVIIFTDAYDVIFLEHWSVVFSRFLDFGADIVFNGERAYWPDTKSIPQIGEYDRGAVQNEFIARFSGPYPQLNSGAYIGYARTVKDMVEWCLKVGEKYDIRDDQALVQCFASACYKTGHYNIVVDDIDQIFATMSHAIEDYTFDGFHVSNRITGKRPAILHANGPKDIMRVFDTIAKIREKCGTNFSLSTIIMGNRNIYYNRGAQILDVGDESGELVLLVSEYGGRNVLFASNGDLLSFRPDLTVDHTASRFREWENLEKNSNHSLFVTHNKENIDIIQYVRNGCQDLIQIKPVDFKDMLHWKKSLIQRILHWSWYW